MSRPICACDDNDCPLCGEEAREQELAGVNYGDRPAVEASMPQKWCHKHGAYGGLFCADCCG